MTLYKIWSVAQQMNNAERNAITHLTSEDSNMKHTLCGRRTGERWDSMGDVLGEDFALDEVGCKRCRKAVTNTTTGGKDG